ncbi:MAG: ribonuclease P protein component [Phycisphaerales bacterium]|nr:ribonuclease P protein component [Phycisphaerales bacterium]
MTSNPSHPDDGSTRHTFRRRHRLALSRDYRAAFDARVRATRGPLTVFGRPNGLPHARLGMSIGRRVGAAHVRVRLKRRLREAFRLLGEEIPAGYDFVVTVRPHAGLRMDAYRDHLRSAAREIDRRWRERSDA